MSRKWQRMVEKNQKDAYKRNKKRGTGNVINGGLNDQIIHKGRSWLVPLVLISFCLISVELFLNLIFYEFHLYLFFGSKTYQIF